MAAILPYDVASSKAGMTERDAALRDFLYTGGQNLDPQTRAWCADFVNATLRESGLPGTNSGMARSFLNYGQPVDQPQKGDIAVFRRGDPNGPSGHVGFYEGEDPSGIRVLGGNQGNAVSSAVYPRDALLGYRRPGAADGAPPTQMAAASPQAPQMPAYPWSPGSDQHQPQANQPTGGAPMGSPMTQQQRPSLNFEQIGKMLGLEAPPPLAQQPPLHMSLMAPEWGLFNNKV